MKLSYLAFGVLLTGAYVKGLEYTVTENDCECTCVDGVAYAHFINDYVLDDNGNALCPQRADDCQGGYEVKVVMACYKCGALQSDAGLECVLDMNADYTEGSTFLAIKSWLEAIPNDFCYKKGEGNKAAYKTCKEQPRCEWLTVLGKDFASNFEANPNWDSWCPVIGESECPIYQKGLSDFATYTIKVTGCPACKAALAPNIDTDCVNVPVPDSAIKMDQTLSITCEVTQECAGSAGISIDCDGEAEEGVVDKCDDVNSWQLSDSLEGESRFLCYCDDLPTFLDHCNCCDPVYDENGDQVGCAPPGRRMHWLRAKAT